MKLTHCQAFALETLDFQADEEATWIMDLGIPRKSVWKLAAAGLVKVTRAKDALGNPGFGYVAITAEGRVAHAVYVMALRDKRSRAA